MAAGLDIVIDVNTQKAIAGFNKFTNKAQSSVAKLNNSFKGLGATLGAFAIGAFVKGSLDAFDKQEKAIAGVEAALKSTENASGKTLKGLLQDASDLQSKTIFGDEEILSSVTNQLLTFTNLTGKTFDRAQKTALDLSTVLKTDVKSSAIGLGKALNNPIKGVTALSRVGVEFTKQQQNQIKTLQSSGDLLGAQNIILKELEKQYGGAAEAAAKAGTGGLQQLGNTLGDIREEIGEALLPIINVFANVIGNVASFIQKNNEAFKDFIKVIGVVAAVMGTLIVVMKIVNFVMAINPIFLIIAGVIALIALIVILVRKYEGWGKLFKKVGQIIKLTWIGVKDSFVTNFKIIGLQIQKLIAKFKRMGEFIKNIFSNIGTAVKLILEGDFSAAKKAFTKSITPDDSEIKAIEEKIDRTRTAFEGRSGLRKTRQEQLKEELKAIKLVKKKQDEAEKTTTTKAIVPGGGTGTGTGAGAGAATVAGQSSVKAITLNFGAIFKDTIINEAQDPLELMDNMKTAVITALADASQFASTG